MSPVRRYHIARVHHVSLAGVDFLKKGFEREGAGSGSYKLPDASSAYVIAYAAYAAVPPRQSRFYIFIDDVKNLTSAVPQQETLIANGRYPVSWINESGGSMGHSCTFEVEFWIT
jgi:hypothetical protein